MKGLDYDNFDNGKYDRDTFDAYYGEADEFGKRKGKGGKAAKTAIKIGGALSTGGVSLLGGLFKKKKKRNNRTASGSGVSQQADVSKAIDTISAIALDEEKAPEQVAAEIIANNPEPVKQFIQNSGQVPVSDEPYALAAQSAMIHEDNVEEKQKNGVPDYDVAESAVYEDYQNSENHNEGDYDSFAPAIFGAVFAAGKKALTAINEKRSKTGKKPLLSGKKLKNLTDKVSKAVTVNEDNQGGLNIALRNISKDATSTPADKSDVGILINAAMAQARQIETNAAIKKYLPFALIGIVVLFIAAKKM